MDSLPPAPPAHSTSATPAGPDVVPPVNAPGDIYPRSARERGLCETASRPDWAYLAGLVVLDAGSIALDSWQRVQHADAWPVRYSGPFFFGVTWGATVGGAWMATPKCDPEWIGETPREGLVHERWPLALSLAIVAGTTAPLINGIVIGDLPMDWTTEERVGHLVVAGVTAFGAAFLPYVLPPSTWRAARELDHIRFGFDAKGGFVGYQTAF